MKLDKTFYGDIVKPTLVMICICILVTLALSGTNLLTKDKIAALALKQQNESMKSLIDADEYIESSIKGDNEEITYYTAKSGDKTKGYIFITTAKGYGGKISVMTALDTDITVTAVKILDASGETPGLGQNVTKESFYSQFKGKNDDGTVAVKYGTANAENEIDAVASATISSRAVTEAVNKAINYASNEFAVDIQGQEVIPDEK